MSKENWEIWSCWYTEICGFEVTIDEDGGTEIDTHGASYLLIPVEKWKELLQNAQEYLRARKEYLIEKRMEERRLRENESKAKKLDT